MRYARKDRAGRETAGCGWEGHGERQRGGRGRAGQEKDKGWDET